MDTARIKRQKVAAACKPCRVKKIKCDGHKPLCAPCQRRGTKGPTCTWDESPADDSLQTVTEQIQSLRDQLQRLQDQNNDYAAAPTTSDLAIESQASHTPLWSSLPASVSTIPRRVEDTLHRENPHTATASFNGPAWHQSLLGKRTDSPPETDPIHAILGPTRDDDGLDGFFGGSSAGNFATSLRRIVEQQIPAAPNAMFEPKKPHQLSGGPFRRWKPRKKRQIDYDLPSRQKADILLSLYWKYVHVLFPVLDQHHVQEHYESLWESGASISVDESFLCLLNVLFALSSKIDTSINLDDREDRASVYYVRARQFMDILDLGSISLVQAYLLLAQYFQSTETPQPGWVLVGMAVRTAQSLGLHLPHGSEFTGDRGKQEMLRRVWHGCVYMDRVFSMTSGRPCMVSREMAAVVPFPEPLCHEFLPAELVGPDTTSDKQPAVVDFYIYNLKLYEILYDILVCYNMATKPDVNTDREEPYDTYFGPFQSESSTSFLGYEQRLSRWKRGLPKHLEIGPRPEQEGLTAVLYRQAVALHQRYLYVRLLLLRPLLSNFVTSDLHQPNTPISSKCSLARRMALQCSVTCVEVARETIQTIYLEKMILPGETGFLSAWWYNVLFLYASGTVLIAGRLNDAILQEVSEDLVLDAWRKASELLGNYARFSKSIQRCFRTLQILYDAIPYRYNRLRQRPSDAEGSFLRFNFETPPETAPQATPNLPISTSPSDLMRVSAVPRQPCDEMDLDLTRAWLESESFDPDDLSWLTYTPFDALGGQPIL